MDQSIDWSTNQSIDQWINYLFQYIVGYAEDDGDHAPWPFSLQTFYLNRRSLANFQWIVSIVNKSFEKLFDVHFLHRWLGWWDIREDIVILVMM